MVQRLEDRSRCAGSWTGTLTQTNGAGTPAAYPVSFTVDSSGWVMSFTGFPSLVTGRVFALSNGAAVARFYTGLDSGNYYNQFRITGTLSANSIQGTYDADSPSDNPVQGTVVLTRQ